MKIDNAALLTAIDDLKRLKIIKRDSEIATTLGYSKGIVSEYVNNKKEVSEIFMRKLFDAYPQLREKSLQKTGTPVYAVEATAGNMELNGYLPEVIEGYINLPSFKDCFAFLYVRGDSMYPKFKAGDLIGLAKLKDIDIIQYGQVYLIITKDDQRMIKYVRKGEDDNHLILRSENKEYDDISLLKKKVSKMFMVKGPIRDDWQ